MGDEMCLIRGAKGENDTCTVTVVDERFLPVWVYLVTHPTAHLCMPMANTASTNADVLDAIKIL